MTPNGIAIRAIRQQHALRLTDLARLTGLSASYLSRIEQGKTGAREKTLPRIAEALGVSPADITRGDDMTIEAKPKRAVPAPASPEGELFHYTPEEAYDNGWLPWKPSVLRIKARAHEIPHNRGASKITFTGLNIREISAMTAVRPLAETRSLPKQRRAVA